MQGGFKRTDLNDTQADSTTLGVSRFWEMSSGWQRAINLRWSLDHFTQANVTNTTMLIYPGVSVNRTRSTRRPDAYLGRFPALLGGLPNTMWGSDINFIVMQAQDVWIRTLYDRHRFVVRGNLGWIEADNFDKVPPDLRFFAGGDRSIRGYKYKSISPKDDDGKLIGASKLASPARWSISTTSVVNGGAPCLSIAAKRSAIFARAISKPAPGWACAGSRRWGRSSWISPDRSATKKSMGYSFTSVWGLNYEFMEEDKPRRLNRVSAPAGNRRVPWWGPPPACIWCSRRRIAGYRGWKSAK